MALDGVFLPGFLEWIQVLYLLDCTGVNMKPIPGPAQKPNGLSFPPVVALLDVPGILRIS